MKHPTKPADSRSSESTPAAPDKALGFRDVAARLGLATNTSHTVRALARRGLIRAIFLNGRTVRYSEASVLALIAGGAK